MLQRGTILDNKYRIEDIIGRGGFGHVYRAREQLTGETVAIKELIPGLGDQEMVQRFIREARATLRLTHPHIARTYGIFQDRGTYYLAMEYLPGGSLADRLQRGALSVGEAVRIAIDLCEALTYAHDKGVVHCDIKPANVLFDEDGEVRLADFGIAHVSEQMMTRQLFTATGAAMGTVRYMAPEQLDGVRDDPRLDIYAVGAMLYEMLSGRPYLDFEDETTPAAQMRNVQRIQSEPPRPLRAVKRRVPVWLAQVVERALRKAPEDRFATAEKLGRALLRKSATSRTGKATASAASSAAKARLFWSNVPGWAWGLGGAAVMGLLALVVGVAFLLGGGGAQPPVLTTVAADTATTAPADTPTPFGTSTPMPSATATASLGDTWTRPADEAVMVYVPAGEFEMGSTEAQFQEAVEQCVDDGGERDNCERWYEYEKPAHTMSLDGFWIDKHEVTNAQFAAFLNEKGNQEEGGTAWLKLDSDYCLIEKSGEEFRSKSGYADHPVVEVSWYGAKAYAEWVGGRLPSEAEWEYAARGKQGLTYPWGDEFDCSLGNFDDETELDEYVVPGGEGCDGYERTAPVGSFPDGASWCGALDLAGNVWEWTRSLYKDYPYDSGDGRENLESDGRRVVRGGAFAPSEVSVRCAYRDDGRYPNYRGLYGFRVVVSPFRRTQ
jgi:serine/threonine-protein kinase